MKTVFLGVAHFLFWTGVALWIPVALVLNVFWGWGDWFSPTLAQHVFLAVGTGFVPALAIVGYLAAEGIKRFATAAALVGCGLVGLGVAGGFAIVVYPHYPDRGPHELIAAAMVLPAIAFPISVIASWKRFKFPPKAWLYASAWACIVIGATIPNFKREMEMALPLSAHVRRWEHSDIQDFSDYYLRADGLDAKDAASYAIEMNLTKRRGSLECGPDAVSDWTPPRDGELWERDDRTPQEDHDRYPSGMAGCFTRMAWSANSVYVCKVCDWGI